MARPREFDEADVVTRARAAFWEHGVLATSIAQLGEATGLSVGSLYKAFRSKRELCALTLDDFLVKGIDELDALLTSAPHPLAGIEAWLDHVATTASDDGPTRGCYAVMCTTELAEADPDVRTRLNRHDDQVRGRLADALRAANAAGEISADPDLGARLLLTTANGVQLESRKGISKHDAMQTLTLALDGLR